MELKNQLLTKYLNNESSPEEVKELLSFFNTKDEAVLLKAIMERFELDKVEPLSRLNPDQDILDKVYLKITSRIESKTPVPLWPNFLKPLAAVAAGVFMIGFLFFYYSDHNKTERELARLEKEDIMPGSDKAYLTLANGKRIVLTDVANGKLASEAGIEISKTDGGQLIYTIKDNQEINSNQTNTIETPKGGQYQVILPDGSKVWLNAASKLTYPVSFAPPNKARRVELDGEAYFEVTRDKARPFKVKTMQQEVEVLGTHFNISGYSKFVKTTLLEGSVKVSLNGSEQEAIVLKPGEQALQKGTTLEVSTVNTDQAVAWKEGWFYFKSNTLSEVLTEAANWYDLEIIYEGKVPADRFTGKVSRSVTLSKFIKMLQLSDVQFSIEGRKMTISSN